MTPDLFCRSQRLQDAFYDLLRAGPVCDIRRFGFQKFGMCEHDAELVIQLVKQHPELWISGETFHASAIHAPWRG